MAVSGRRDGRPCLPPDALVVLAKQVTKFEKKSQRLRERIPLETKPMPPTTFQFPRAVLLVEIERYCSFPDCRALNRIGLTKSETIEYRGFDCAKCQRWNDDVVSTDALPEEWNCGMTDPDDQNPN